MYLTLTVRTKDGNETDIQVNEDQIIDSALKMLVQHGDIDGDAASGNFVKTYLRNKLVSRYHTFKETDILNGDIVTVI
ncbi:MAG: hypothetical protein VB031_09575 [Eubacteriaceae bacterium]|nr:hypothetical protein [Eubacteriaceae bacterium]